MPALDTGSSLSVTPRFQAAEKRCQLSSLLYHAMCIVVDDVDAVKGHAEHADYKYRDRRSQLRALELLIRQYDLQNRTDKGFGDRVQFTALGLRHTFPKRLPYLKASGLNYTALWRRGSSLVLPQQLEEWRKYSQYSQENDGMVIYGILPTVWSCTGVEEALEQLNLHPPTSVAVSNSQKWDQSAEGSTATRQTDEHAARTLRKRALSYASPDDTNDIGSTGDRAQRLVLRNMTKRRRVISEDEDLAIIDLRSPSDSDIQQMPVVVSAAEEFDIGKPAKMVRSLPGELNNFVGRLFRELGFQQDLPLIPGSNVSPITWQAGLQDLCKTCWGDDWVNVLKHNRTLLVASDAVQTLASGYLHRDIFQSDDAKWCEFVRRADGNVPYSVVKEVLRPSFHRNGQSIAIFAEASTDGFRDQSSSGAISSMILNCDNTQLQHYHKILIQSLPIYVLSSEELRQKALTAFAKGLFDTLEPLLNPSNAHPDWRFKLQQPTHELIEHALNIKQSTTPTDEYAFRFLWAEHGTPVDPDLMLARALSPANVPVVVLTTLVPGLSYQQKGQQKWVTLWPAEILEKVGVNQL